MKRNKCARRKSEATSELREIDTRLHKLADRLSSACKKDVDKQLLKDLLDARLSLRVGIGGILEKWGSK